MQSSRRRLKLDRFAQSRLGFVVSAAADQDAGEIK